MPLTGRSVPWRQGHFLPDGALQSFGVTESADRLAIVVSHDCDIVQTPSVEPNVEIVIGRSIESPDGNFTHSKNPRKLHLVCTAGTQRSVVELVATKKMAVPKEGEAGLLNYAPREDIRLSGEELVILQQWLAARYRRFAFPDEFDHRLIATGARDQLVRILKRHGTHILAIYFDVDDGEDTVHDGPDDPYKLTISLLYSTGVAPDEAERAAMEASKSIRSAFKNKCCLDGIHWKWIELADCEILADNAMTVAQASFLKKWQTDYISFRSDPPQQMLGEV
jgi:hypothetical protein